MKGDVMVFVLMINLMEFCDIMKYEDFFIINVKFGVKKDDVFYWFVLVVFFRFDELVMVVGVSILVMGFFGFDCKMFDVLIEGIEVWVLLYFV